MPEPLDEPPGDAESRQERRSEPVQIIACPDGPLLIRGDAVIVDPDGAPLPRRRRTVALCRCGRSTLKPYCDGTHKLIGFRTEPERPEQIVPTPQGAAVDAAS